MTRPVKKRRGSRLTLEFNTNNGAAQLAAFLKDNIDILGMEHSLSMMLVSHVGESKEAS